MGDTWFMHGRDSRHNLMIYTSPDGLTWDEGHILQKKGTGIGAYSNSIVTGLLNPEKKPRLLVQASHAYKDSKCNIWHFWIDGKEASGAPNVESAVKTDASNKPLTYRRFTVEEKDGRVFRLTPIPDEAPPMWARGVSQAKKDWSNGPDPEEPYFKAPIRFVHPPEDEGEPFYDHNHGPSMTWLENGDLLAIWFSTGNERGAEMTVLASRLRDGSHAWDPSSEFFKADDRNMTGQALSVDGKGVIHHFNGMSTEGAGKGYDNLALLMRTSSDMGVTWSPPEAVIPEFTYSGGPQAAPMFKTSSGVIALACDHYHTGPSFARWSSAETTARPGPT